MPLKLRSHDSKIRAPAVPPRETVTSKSALTQEKQRKLEEILQREMVRTKAEQLKTMLTKKMTLKYGRYEQLNYLAPNLLPRHRIHHEVIAEVIRNNLSGSSKVTSDDLSALEKKVQDAVKANLDSASNKKTVAERPEETTLVIFHYTTYQKSKFSF